MCAAIRATASPFFGFVPLRDVVAARPIGIGHDRLTPHFVERDVLRRMPRRGRKRQRREHALGIARRPLQHLHAAHRSAGRAEQTVDAKVIEQHRLRPHHVANGDDRKTQTVRLARRRVHRMRPRRTHAPADHVDADHVKAVRVDRQARPHHRRPPPGLARHGVRARRILIAGQRMADQERVRLRSVQRAERLPRNRDRRQRLAGVELQRRKRVRLTGIAGRGR